MSFQQAISDLLHAWRQKAGIFEWIVCAGNAGGCYVTGMHQPGSIARQAPGVVLDLDPQQQHLDGHDDGELIAVDPCPAQVHDHNGSLQAICCHINGVPA